MENKLIKLEVENKYLKQEIELLKNQLNVYQGYFGKVTTEVGNDWLKDDFEETKKFFEDRDRANKMSDAEFKKYYEGCK